MAKLRRYVTRIGITATLGVAALALSERSSAQEQRPPTPVTVTNTSANPVPVTGSIGVSGPVPVTQSGDWSVQTSDLFAPGATATRYGPVNLFSPGSATIVPAVPDGSAFIVKYVNVFGASDSGADLTDASCLFRIVTGPLATRAGSLPLRINVGHAVGSEQLFLPLKAGEALSLECSTRPVTSGSFTIVVGGHFVPADN